MANDTYAKWRPFGTEAQRLRLLAGLTQRQLGSRIKMSHGMLGSIERAQRAPRVEHADAMDRVLDTGGALSRLWHDIAGKRDVPPWFKDALLLERRAAEIREYEPMIIPGLLQTYAYARASIGARPTRRTSEELDHAARSRAERLPAILPERPMLIFIIRQIVFEQVVGDEAIMREQLRHIVKHAEEGAIQVQVLPHSPNTIGLRLPFRLYKLNETQQRVVYVEHSVGGEVFDAPDTVDDQMDLFGQLQAEALSPTASIKLIRTINGDRYGDVEEK